MSSQHFVNTSTLRETLFQAKRRGRTARVIATRAAIEYTRFSKIVNGRQHPTPKEKSRIARVLRRPIGELFPPDALQDGAAA